MASVFYQARHIGDWSFGQSGKSQSYIQAGLGSRVGGGHWQERPRYSQRESLRLCVWLHRVSRYDSTGTPSGVGFARMPPVFLKPGDKVAGEVEAIGILEIEVVAP